MNIDEKIGRAAALAAEGMSIMVNGDGNFYQDAVVKLEAAARALPSREIAQRAAPTHPEGNGLITRVLLAEVAIWRILDQAIEFRGPTDQGFWLTPRCLRAALTEEQERQRLEGSAEDFLQWRKGMTNNTAAE